MDGHDMAAFHEFDFFTAGRSGVEFGAALLQIMGGERARIGRNKREFANDADLVWKNPIVGTCGKLPQLGDIEQTTHRQRHTHTHTHAHTRTHARTLALTQTHTQHAHTQTHTHTHTHTHAASRPRRTAKGQATFGSFRRFRSCSVSCACHA